MLENSWVTVRLLGSPERPSSVEFVYSAWAKYPELCMFNSESSWRLEHSKGITLKLWLGCNVSQIGRSPPMLRWNISPASSRIGSFPGFLFGSEDGIDAFRRSIHALLPCFTALNRRRLCIWVYFVDVEQIISAMLIVVFEISQFRISSADFPKTPLVSPTKFQDCDLKHVMLKFLLFFADRHWITELE
jgi:hypothetical protein